MDTNTNQDHAKRPMVRCQDGVKQLVATFYALSLVEYGKMLLDPVWANDIRTHEVAALSYKLCPFVMRR